LTESKTYKFKFNNFEKEYETFNGVAGRVRYFIRVVVGAKTLKFSTVKEEDFAVLLPDESVEREM
jgi:vacuolar protein sorting-associated protein 26